MYMFFMFENARFVVNKRPHHRCIYLLHRRLGHASFSIINKTLALLGKEKVEGCNLYLDCDVCKQCKSKVHSLAKKK